MAKAMTIRFDLDEKDVSYFRNLYRTARKNATEADQQHIHKEVRKLIDSIRASEKQPQFVTDALAVLEDLLQMLEDQDYALPKTVSAQARGALAYFANPQDVIPDHIPAIGFLDDAIMIKIIEQEFIHELWAYRKFRTFRAGAEQRPWTSVAGERLPKRLINKRKELRGQIQEKTARDREKASRKGFW